MTSVLNANGCFIGVSAIVAAGAFSDPSFHPAVNP
jgi:hypothetical protein